MLKVNQLIGFGVSGQPVSKFTGAYENATNSATYNFTNCDIGTPASNRVVVVAWTANNPRISNPTSITVNGVSATSIVETGNANRPSSLWRASVSSGSTGVTITVAMGGTNTGQNCVIGVYAIYPSSATPVDSASVASAGGSTTASLTDLAKTASGVAVFVTHTITTTTTCTVTVTGETVVQDAQNTSFGGISYAFHSIIPVASTTTLDDPLATWSATSSERAFVGATWV